MSELNNLIDLVDGFIAGETFGERWNVANRVIQNLGGVALNVGEFDMHLGQVKWVTSSMSHDWMTHYMEEGYFEGDSVVAHGTRSFDTMVLNTGLKRVDAGSTELEVRVDQDLFDFGYKGFLAQAFSLGASSNRFAATLVSDSSINHIDQPDVAAQFQRVSAVISAFLGSPYDGSCGDVYFVGQSPLTPREREVLSLLASGYMYSRIADRLGLAEITVRTHVKSAREKLGAATREQAIAIAIRDRLIEI